MTVWTNHEIVFFLWLKCIQFYIYNVTPTLQDSSNLHPKIMIHY